MGYVEWRLADAHLTHGKKVFSCFSCGGGSAMGYLLAGYDVIGNVECDPKVNAVYQENLHPRFSYTEDIRDFTEATGLPGELYDLDILDGSPPCTPFTILQKDRDKTWGKEVYHIEGGKKQRWMTFFSGLSSWQKS